MFRRISSSSSNDSFWKIFQYSPFPTYSSLNLNSEENDQWPIKSPIINIINYKILITINILIVQKNFIFFVERFVLKNIPIFSIFNLLFPESEFWRERPMTNKIANNKYNKILITINILIVQKNFIFFVDSFWKIFQYSPFPIYFSLNLNSEENDQWPIKLPIINIIKY